MGTGTDPAERVSARSQLNQLELGVFCPLSSLRSIRLLGRDPAALSFFMRSLNSGESFFRGFLILDPLPSSESGGGVLDGVPCFLVRTDDLVHDLG